MAQENAPGPGEASGADGRSGTRTSVARGPDSPGPLTPAESATLARLEATIEKSVVTVGKALAEIRDRRLYRDHYSTFENYVRTRWGHSRQWAHLQIKAAEVAAQLSTPVDIPERVLRPLASIEPAKRREVWERAQASAGSGRVTEDHVRAAASPKSATVAKVAELANVSLSTARRALRELHVQRVDALADAAELLADLAEPRLPKVAESRRLLAHVRELVREVRGTDAA